MEQTQSKTRANLEKALAGESIARNKYTYFAQAARQNGQPEIAEAFEQMAQNEMMHAKFWFERLYGKPGGVKDCLTQAAQGEYAEWREMYPEFARQAREEGMEDLAAMFEKVADIERSHEKRFLTLLAQLSGPAVVQEKPAAKTRRDGYRCQFCGAVFASRPDVCDTCGAIGAFDYVQWEE